MASKKTARTRRKKPNPTPKTTNVDAAGIDLGATVHYVAVPADRDVQPVRHFGTLTGDLNELVDWLIKCRITTVAMEATGVYWIPLFQILEDRGLEVNLVNARHVKNGPGRKSDVQDWLARSRSYRPSAWPFGQPTPRLPPSPVLPVTAKRMPWTTVEKVPLHRVPSEGPTPPTNRCARNSTRSSVSI